MEKFVGENNQRMTLIFAVVLMGLLAEPLDGIAFLGMAGESGCTQPECFLPEAGRRYTFMVHYPDGDSGTLTMVPEYDGKSGILTCHSRAYSELYHKFIESNEQYQYLPDGIYRIGSIGSGVPQLWLPAELAPGIRWETDSGSHRVVACDVHCPSKLMSGTNCLQVVSHYHVMGDLEVESYYAEGFGRILSRLRSSSCPVEFELTAVENGPVISALPARSPERSARAEW